MFYNAFFVCDFFKSVQPFICNCIIDPFLGFITLQKNFLEFFKWNHSV